MRTACHSQHSGALLYIPDIAPLPNRDELRPMLEDTARSSAGTADHLKEWIELVSADTQGKKSIQKYARWFEIQHVLEVLYSRHADHLNLCFRKVEAALSASLHINADTLHGDLREIKKRLGPNWFLS